MGMCGPLVTTQAGWGWSGSWACRLAFPSPGIGCGSAWRWGIAPIALFNSPEMKACFRERFLFHAPTYPT